MGYPSHDEYEPTRRTRHEQRLERVAARDRAPAADWRQDKAARIWQAEPRYQPERGTRESWEASVDRNAADYADRRAAHYRRGASRMQPLPEDDHHDMISDADLDVLVEARELEHHVRKALEDGNLHWRTRTRLLETLGRIETLADHP